MRIGSEVVVHSERAFAPANGDENRAFATGVAAAGLGVLLADFGSFEVEKSSLLPFDFQSGIFGAEELCDTISRK